MKIVKKDAQIRPGNTRYPMVSRPCRAGRRAVAGKGRGAQFTAHQLVDSLAGLGPRGETTLPVLALDVSFENYNALLQQREQVLVRRHTF